MSNLTEILLGNLYRNINECATPLLRANVNFADIAVRGKDGDRYICPQANCPGGRPNRPHIHIYSGDTGAGWPAGRLNKFETAYSMDAAMTSLRAWAFNYTDSGEIQEVDSTNNVFKKNGWKNTIECVIEKTKSQTGYEYPITYSEYLSKSAEYDAAILTAATVIDDTFDKPIFDRLKERSALMQSVVNTSIMLSGGLAMPDPTLSLVPKSRGQTKETIKEAFYENTARLLVPMKDIYMAIKKRCFDAVRAAGAVPGVGRPQYTALMARLQRNATRRINEILARAWNRQERNYQTVVRELIDGTSGAPPTDTPTFCDREGGTRRKNGRRRTQKKRKTYV